MCGGVAELRVLHSYIPKFGSKNTHGIPEKSGPAGFSLEQRNEVETQSIIFTSVLVVKTFSLSNRMFYYTTAFEITKNCRHYFHYYQRKIQISNQYYDCSNKSFSCQFLKPFV